MFHIFANLLFRPLIAKIRHGRAATLLILQLLLLLHSVALHADQRQGLLYKFQKPGAEVHYLFGTMHAADPRVLGMLKPIEKPLSQSSQLVMEMVPDVTAMISSSASMMLPAGQTLEQLLGKVLYRKVLAAVSDKGFTDPILQKFKPWAAAITLSLPEPEGAFLDQHIYQLALQNGQSVYGLESAAEQLAIFEGMDQALQITMLQETIDQLPQLPTLYGAMVEAYASRDLEKLQQLTIEYELSSSNEALSDWFMQELLVKRNIRMAERLHGLLEQGSTFVAVGALHLVGETGLIQTLKQAGYQVDSVF